MDVEIVNERIRSGGGQWCYGARSFWFAGVPVELEVRPEGSRWWGQFPPVIRLMLGSAWVEVAPPPLDGVVVWPGTHGRDGVDGLWRERQIMEALDVLQEYACGWLRRKLA